MLWSHRESVGLIYIYLIYQKKKKWKKKWGHRHVGWEQEQQQ